MLNFRNIFFFLFSLLIVGPARALEFPKNILLFVGDGMGEDHIRAAGFYLAGNSGIFSFEKFPYRSVMTTDALNKQTTDSAASATAMATGRKVRPGLISKDPQTGADLETLGEFFKKKGKKIGLVTTSHITDATPAAFAAHSMSRKTHGAILENYFQGIKPNVLFGAFPNFRPSQGTGYGYTVLQNVNDLNLIKSGTDKLYVGQFSSEWYLEWEYRRLTFTPDQPSLSQMTSAAIRALSNPNGFFLLVENELIDNAGHQDVPPGTDRTRMMIEEIKSLSDAVQAAMEWAKSQPNTLILVVSDHESGDFSLQDTRGWAGVIPKSKWGSANHTRKKVPVYGWGNGDAQFVAGGTLQVADNTDIYKLLANRWSSDK